MAYYFMARKIEACALEMAWLEWRSMSWQQISRRNQQHHVEKCEKSMLERFQSNILYKSMLELIVLLPKNLNFIARPIPNDGPMSFSNDKGCMSSA